MTATLTDYLVLEGGPFEPSEGNHTVFPLTLPNDMLENTHLARPILMFKAKALPAPPFAADGEFEIDVNGATVGPFAVEQEIIRGLWDVLPGDALHRGGDNFIRFRVTRGRILFADAVLWFQRRVDA